MSVTKPKKTYVLDTDVLIQSPYSIFSFEEHGVVVVDASLEELERIKNGHGDSARNALTALRTIETLFREGTKVGDDGCVATPEGGTFTIYQCSPKQVVAIGLEPTPQNRILAACEDLFYTKKRSEHAPSEVILVTNNLLRTIRAEEKGFNAEPYRSDQTVEVDKQYSGRKELYVPTSSINELYTNGQIKMPENVPVTEREFFLLMDEVDPSHSALATYHNCLLSKLRYAESRPYGIIPKNVGQRFALEALLRPVEEAPLVILKAPAGTAKTFLTMAAGLQKVLEDKEYSRLLIARNNVLMDAGLGYLPGSIEDKVSPILAGAIDNLMQLTKTKSSRTKDGFQLPDSYANELISKGIIKMEAIAYLRGRSICDTWIVIDEAQNMTPAQAHSIITRVGLGSKIILCGDPEQCDSPYLDSRTNGLSFASEKMKGSPLCWQVSFKDDECVRSQLALESLRKLAPKGFGTV